MRTGIETYSGKLGLRTSGIQVPEGPFLLPDNGGPDSHIQVMGDPHPDVYTQVVISSEQQIQIISAVGSLASRNLVRSYAESNEGVTAVRISDVTGWAGEEGVPSEAQATMSQ